MVWRQVWPGCPTRKTPHSAAATGEISASQALIRQTFREGEGFCALCTPAAGNPSAPETQAATPSATIQAATPSASSTDTLATPTASATGG
jgi:hypothetical protein